MWRLAETGRAIPMRPRSFPNKCSWITYEFILSNKPGGRWESRPGTAAPGREFDWHWATLWNDWHDLHEKDARIGSPQTAQRTLLDAPFLYTVRTCTPILPKNRWFASAPSHLESRTWVMNLTTEK